MPARSKGPKGRRRLFSRWLARLGLTQKLYLVTLVSVPVVVILALATVLAMGILSGLRAYVAGESLYSKYQKDAVFYLQRYLHDAEQHNYTRFLASIRVPLSDGLARRALAAGDFEAATGHFRAGLNAAEDIPWIIFIYRHFGESSAMREAVRLWEEADSKVDEIYRTGQTIRRELAKTNPSHVLLDEAEERIELLNQEAIAAENAFSRTIGETYRQAARILVQAIVILGILLLGGGVVFAHIVSRHVAEGVRELMRGVEELSAGNLLARVDLPRRDELGRLATAVNQMGESIEKGQHDLRRTASLLSATLDSTADGILVIGSQGQILAHNRRFAVMWKIPPGVLEAGNDAALDFVLSQLREPESFLARIRQLYADPDAESRDVIEFLDGRVFERFSKPQKVEGETVGRVWSFRDITDQKRAAEALLLARQVAENASHAKSDFLANVSHELRTPLNSVIGVADLLSESHLELEQREYVATLQRSSKLLLNLIDQVLDLSKVEAGRLELEAIDFDLEEVADDVCPPLALRAQTKGLEFSCRIAPDVPRRLTGDPKRLTQILVNLISNAVKFTETGFVRMEVENLSGRPDGSLLFTIRDSGAGIPEETRERIFESFMQLDSSITRRFGGSGLGLAISKRLVELMGGRIWVESEVGRGSIFRFSARLLVNDQLEDEPVLARGAGEPAIRPSAGAPGAQGRIRLLLVEDSPDNTALINLFLRKEDIALTMAADGAEGVRKFQEGEFDVVLMDLQMPVMDGYTATRTIRAWEAENHRSPTPILAFTAHAMTRDRDECLAAGCDGYLTKPIKKRQLLDAVRDSATMRVPDPAGSTATPS